VNHLDLQGLMLANNVSLIELARETGFLQHQMRAAVQGKATITDAMAIAIREAVAAIVQHRKEHRT
jgi:plasmid maintenance system antidote protein VapI